MNFRASGYAATIGLLACNVAAPPGSTGGVVFDASVGPDGRLANAADGGAAAACERGVVVVDSDYQSTNVTVSQLDGTTLSGSFVSSGATRPGLSLALSGDVDVPLVAPASGRVLLLDRYGTNVLTWLKLGDASVIAQLPVGQGFEANPHDYVEVDARRAYVTRFGTNPAPGARPFDQGGDVLILDTTTPAITGRIAIPEENPALRPDPDLMSRLGNEVVVSLGRWSADFKQVGDGRFIGISPSTNAIDWTVTITGLQACGRVAFSPSGKRGAVACSGMDDMTTKTFMPDASDVVLYDTTETPPRELRRLGLGAKLGNGLQPNLAFASEDLLLVLTYGGNATAGDTVVGVSAATGDATTLGQTVKAFALGGIHCAPGCGDTCLLADAEKNVLRRWHVDGDTFTPLADAVVDTVVGLPPRDIGGLR